MFRDRVRATLALLAATSLAPQLAQAQYTTVSNTTHHWLAIGFGGGEVIPTGNATQTFDRSFQGQAYIVINLGILPELRFNFGYQRLDFKRDFLNSVGIPTSTTAYNSTMTGIAGTRIDLLKLPVRPYLTLGVGAFNVKTVIDTTGTGGHSVTSPAHLNFGLDGGAGIAANIGRFEAFTEARVQNVYSNKGFINSAKQIQAVPVSFGLLFHLL
jgi:hypothetical protein